MAHDRVAEDDTVKLANARVLLISIPELTPLPTKTFPPLSLQVLKDSLGQIGVTADMHDLAAYGPTIAAHLSGQEFYQTFHANTEYGVVDDENAHRLDFSPALDNAVRRSGLDDAFLALIQQGKWNLIGFSIPGTPLSSDLFAAGLCRRLARIAKRIMPDTPIVIGGARTIEKDNVLTELMADPAVDYLVRGNGYRSIRALIENVIGKRVALDRIPGLVYRDKGTVQVAIQDPPWGHLAVPIWIDRSAIVHYRRTLSELEARCRLIPEVAELPPNHFYVIPFQFTIGCVSDCAFCNRASERGRISRPEEAVDYLERAVKEFGNRNFMFLNSEINFGRTYVHRFCDELERRKLDLRWTDSCEFRGLDEDTIKRMRDVGCVALWFGLETTTDRLLGYIQKRTTVQHATRMLEIADRVGIYNCLNLICGFPSETEEDVQATLRYLREHRDIIDTTQINIFYLQGGPFFDTPERFRLKLRGYQEQVGETMCRAFDELDGLSWEAKKEQMLTSYARVASLDDELFSEASRNMPVITALYRSLGDDKRRVVEVINQLGDGKFGNFFEAPTECVRHDGRWFLLDATCEQVLEVNDIVARCYSLRHLRSWDHIRRVLLREYSEATVTEGLEAIARFEANGNFRWRKRKPFRRIEAMMERDTNNVVRSNAPIGHVARRQRRRSLVRV